MNSWTALREEFRDAPPGARRTVWSGLGMVTLIVVVGVADLSDGVDPGEILRWGVALLGSVGLALHTVAEALHRTGRARAAEGGASRSERFRARILRRSYPILPMLALGATSLLAFASGAMVVVGAAHVRFWLAAGIFGFFAYRAGRTLVASARELYGEARSQRDSADRARSAATEARLLALQARMNPHFLFNALNTVAALLRTDPRAAERTVESLSVLLRRTLQRSGELLSTVEDEIEYVTAYLAVQAERFGDRLEVEWAVAPDALARPIPPMTLQPLVENALEHGVEARIGGGRIRIAVRVEDDELVATVSDDGPGMAETARERTGLGNLRERVETLYGESARLDVTSGVDGTTVRIRLPASVPGDVGDGKAVEEEVPCAS